MRPVLGSKNPAAKLTEEDAALIKALLREKHPIKDIAAKFNISEATIYDIKRGKTWNHVA